VVALLIALCVVACVRPDRRPEPGEPESEAVAARRARRASEALAAQQAAATQRPNVKVTANALQGAPTPMAAAGKPITGQALTLSPTSGGGVAAAAAAAGGTPVRGAAQAQDGRAGHVTPIPLTQTVVVVQSGASDGRGGAAGQGMGMGGGRIVLPAHDDADPQFAQIVYAQSTQQGMQAQAYGAPPSVAGARAAAVSGGGYIVAPAPTGIHAARKVNSGGGTGTTPLSAGANTYSTGYSLAASGRLAGTAGTPPAMQARQPSPLLPTGGSGPAAGAGGSPYEYNYSRHQEAAQAQAQAQAAADAQAQAAYQRQAQAAAAGGSPGEPRSPASPGAGAGAQPSASAPRVMQQQPQPQALGIMRRSPVAGVAAGVAAGGGGAPFAYMQHGGGYGGAAGYAGGGYYRQGPGPPGHQHMGSMGGYPPGGAMPYQQHHLPVGIAGARRPMMMYPHPGQQGQGQPMPQQQQQFGPGVAGPAYGGQPGPS
jgi:hypothetical protein